MPDMCGDAMDLQDVNTAALAAVVSTTGDTVDEICHEKH